MPNAELWSHVAYCESKRRYISDSVRSMQAGSPSTQSASFEGW
jgi:hypothetical protein